MRHAPGLHQHDPGPRLDNLPPDLGPDDTLEHYRVLILVAVRMNRRAERPGRQRMLHHREPALGPIGREQQHRAIRWPDDILAATGHDQLLTAAAGITIGTIQQGTTATAPTSARLCGYRFPPLGQPAV